MLAETIFKFLDDLVLFGEKLSSSINDLIETTIPADKMNSMIRRIKHVQHLCRHEHLDAAMITGLVKQLFPDETDDFRATIATQIAFVLHAK